MKNKNIDRELHIQSLGHKLIRLDANANLIEKLKIEYSIKCRELREEWDQTWRERQKLINEAAQDEAEDALDDFNYVGSKHHY